MGVSLHEEKMNQSVEQTFTFPNDDKQSHKKVRTLFKSGQKGGQLLLSDLICIFPSKQSDREVVLVQTRVKWE